MIELVVVIAIIGIIVLMSTQKMLNYQKEARLTRIRGTVKSLEFAIDNYLLDNGDFPRLADDPYTVDDIDVFSQSIYNITGEVVSLDPEGNYYNIDYDKIAPYMNKPRDYKNYILQNPVGRVFYMAELTREGKDRLPDKVDIPTLPDDNNSLPICEGINQEMFSGLGPEAFDKDPSTTFVMTKGVTEKLTWIGNMDNRKLAIDGHRDARYAVLITIYDINDNKLNFSTMDGTYSD